MSATMSSGTASFLKMLNSLTPEEISAEGIEALGLGGSFGHYGSSPDEYSDVDLFILLADEGTQKMEAAVRSILNRFGTPALFRGPTWVEGYGYSFSAIFCPLMLCQLNVNTRETLSSGPQRRHTKIIFDRTGYLTQFTHEQLGVTHNTRQIFECSTSLFWLRALNTWRDIQRGDVFLALRHLENLRSQLIILLRISADRPPLDYRVPEKHLEIDMESLIIKQLQASIASYDSQALARSLDYMTFLHWKHGMIFANHHKFPYPKAAAEAIRNLISPL